jgi:large subunit ribosomal protein L14
VVKGEVRRALVVGYYAHESERSHAFCSTDIHNVVLIDKDGNPIGTRILVPVPHALRHLRADTTVAKVLAIATKFV